MRIKKSPYSQLGKPEQGSKLFLKSKREFQIRTEEPGRRKTGEKFKTKNNKKLNRIEEVTTIQAHGG
jgi:hypothetical protein